MQVNIVVHAPVKVWSKAEAPKTSLMSVTPEVSAPMSWLKAGAGEHPVHRRDAGSVPRADVLVKDAAPEL